MEELVQRGNDASFSGRRTGGLEERKRTSRSEPGLRERRSRERER
jgi:hypothetical protein